MLGLGHLLGYVAGTLDLLKYFGHFLGDSQFKQLCIIAGAAIVFSNGITSYCVQERILLSRPFVWLTPYIRCLLIYLQDRREGFWSDPHAVQHHTDDAAFTQEDFGRLLDYFLGLDWSVISLNPHSA